MGGGGQRGEGGRVSLHVVGCSFVVAAAVVDYDTVVSVTGGNDANVSAGVGAGISSTIVEAGLMSPLAMTSVVSSSREAGPLFTADLRRWNTRHRSPVYPRSLLDDAVALACWNLAVCLRFLAAVVADSVRFSRKGNRERNAPLLHSSSTHQASVLVRRWSSVASVFYRRLSAQHFCHVGR